VASSDGSVSMERAAVSNSGFYSTMGYTASSLPAIAEDLPTCLVVQEAGPPHMGVVALSSSSRFAGHPNIEH